MVLMDDHRPLLHAQKDDLLKHVKKALADAGLGDFDLQSIHLNYKHVRR